MSNLKTPGCATPRASSVLCCADRKITIGVAAGLLLGLLFAFDVLPHTIAGFSIVDVFRFAGNVFMRLLKMIVVPLVFFSIFVGVTSVGDTTRLSKLGLRTVDNYVVEASDMGNLANALLVLDDVELPIDDDVVSHNQHYLDTVITFIEDNCVE